jgi:hypothetical protein
MLVQKFLKGWVDFCCAWVFLISFTVGLRGAATVLKSRPRPKSIATKETHDLLTYIDSIISSNFLHHFYIIKKSAINKRKA